MRMRIELPTQGRASLDTCVLVYAIDASQGARFDVARSLLERALIDGWPICLQVLGEFYRVVTRKKMLEPRIAARLIGEWKTLMTPCASSAEAFDAALTYAARSQAQFWDALILATCAEHGVSVLFTEDIGPQRRALGVRLSNPF